MTLKDEPCYRELAEDVRSFADGKPVVEIVNSGNWGDGLIHAGQAAFLRDIGVKVTQIPISKFRKSTKRKIRTAFKELFPSGKAIVTGSGAYRKFYDRPAEIFKAVKQFSNVLIMPSSFPFAPSVDAARTVVWRRDKLESMDGAPDARFCHDMAFYLDPAPREPTKGVGMLFRTDIEKDDFAIPDGNIDLSNEGTNQSDPEAFFDRVGEYDVICTNRLHVGIAGALLNREVHLFGNRTPKVRSIFECSLRPFYENVHFHSDASELPNLNAREARQNG